MNMDDLLERCTARAHSAAGQLYVGIPEAVAKAIARVIIAETDVRDYHEALRQIATLRPHGDVDKARNPTGLVKQMESLALRALLPLDTKKACAKPKDSLTTNNKTLDNQ